MPLEWEEEATREQVLLRAALVGANGSGKTLGALKIARGVAGPEGKVAVVDTEKKRAKLYADRFKFAHAPLLDHRPEAFVAAARDAAERVGPTGVVVIDTISHEWLEVLTEVDKFGDWKSVTPRHQDFVEGLISIPAHLIVTMRAKVKYGIEEVDVPGRSKPRQVITRLGVGPVQREGVEYEFDILAYLDSDHMAHFSNRCDPLVGKVLEIDEETIDIIKQWLEEGDAPKPQRIVTLSDIPVPRSWAAIKEAAEAYSEATWADFRTFLGQARDELFPGVDEKDLSKGQKDVLFQKAAGVMIKLLETHDPGLFPPPNRIEFQAHWSPLLEGAVLPGPEWSMDQEEAEAGWPSRVEPGSPPEPQSSREEQASPQSPATATPPLAEPSPSLEHTVTDGPLTDGEQAVLDSVAKEFGGAAEVPTTVADEVALAKARLEKAVAEAGTAREEE